MSAAGGYGAPGGYDAPGGGGGGGGGGFNFSKLSGMKAASGKTKTGERTKTYRVALSPEDPAGAYLLGAGFVEEATLPARHVRGRDIAATTIYVRRVVLNAADEEMAINNGVAVAAAHAAEAQVEQLAAGQGAIVAIPDSQNAGGMMGNSQASLTELLGGLGFAGDDGVADLAGMVPGQALVVEINEDDLVGMFQGLRYSSQRQRGGAAHMMMPAAVAMRQRGGMSYSMPVTAAMATMRQRGGMSYSMPATAAAMRQRGGMSYSMPATAAMATMRQRGGNAHMMLPGATMRQRGGNAHMMLPGATMRQRGGMSYSMPATAAMATMRQRGGNAHMMLPGATMRQRGGMSYSMPTGDSMATVSQRGGSNDGCPCDAEARKKQRGGARKSHKTKSHKTKSHKTKSHKGKSHKKRSS